MVDPIKPKPRRRLSKNQIIEILERNVSLYKDEPEFTHYIVELAIYLMEYEYDWTESDGEAPPRFRRMTEEPAPLAANSTTEPNGKKGKVLYTQITPGGLNGGVRRLCPFCGNDVGDSLICPSCRNLTR